MENIYYKRIGNTILPSGKRISTVWLGMGGFGIAHLDNMFETMVFDTTAPDDARWRELDMERYSTEAEAKEGHKRMVERWKKADGQPLTPLQ